MITEGYNKGSGLYYKYTSPWFDKFAHELFEFGPEPEEVHIGSDMHTELTAHRVTIRNKLWRLLKKTPEPHQFDLAKTPWEHNEWYQINPGHERTWTDYFNNYKFDYDNIYYDTIYMENDNEGKVCVSNFEVRKFDPTLVSLNFGTYKDIHEWRYVAKMKRSTLGSIYTRLKARTPNSLLELAKDDYKYLWDPAECMIVGNTFFCDEYFFLTPGLFSDIIEAREIHEESVIFLDTTYWKH
jgi:hypothetical protein